MDRVGLLRIPYKEHTIDDIRVYGDDEDVRVEVYFDQNEEFDPSDESSTRVDYTTEKGMLASSRSRTEKRGMVSYRDGTEDELFVATAAIARIVLDGAELDGVTGT